MLVETGISMCFSFSESHPGIVKKVSKDFFVLCDTVFQKSFHVPPDLAKMLIVEEK